MCIPDDFQLKLDAILDEIKELEDELSEIENPKDPREHVLVPVREKIQVREMIFYIWLTLCHVAVFLV